jgi:hypothetical protein
MIGALSILNSEGQNARGLLIGRIGGFHVTQDYQLAGCGFLGCFGFF